MKEHCHLPEFAMKTIKTGIYFGQKNSVEGKMDGEFIEYSDNNKLLKKWNLKAIKCMAMPSLMTLPEKLLFHGIYKTEYWTALY